MHLFFLDEAALIHNTHHGYAGAADQVHGELAVDLRRHPGMFRCNVAAFKRNPSALVWGMKTADTE